MRPVVLVGGIFAVVIGVPLGLYAFLTGDQQRTTRTIKAEAIARGWRFRKQRWTGNPAAFRIDGRTWRGLPWILTSANTSSGSDKGWSVQLTLRFPTLGGEPDFAIEPRASRKLDAPPGVSGALASLAKFSRAAQELASGWRPFDAAYRMLVLPDRIGLPPVDSALAQRILGWPADSTKAAIKPHSVVAWRHASACEIEARLPDSPSVPTVLWLVALGEDLMRAFLRPSIPRLRRNSLTGSSPAFCDNLTTWRQTTSHLSLEEFHRAYDGVKPNHEYWFGEASPKLISTLLHSAVQTALILLLFSRGWKVFPEVTLKMGPDAALVPDLIATRRPLAQP